jgi:hypothetical protein
MKTILIAAAMAVSALALPVPSMAGDHGSHPPMGPPLSVICAALPADAQFDCLHPGYVSMLSGNGLSHTFSSPCHDGLPNTLSIGGDGLQHLRCSS